MQRTQRLQSLSVSDRFFVQMCSSCRLVQYIDAAVELGGGHIKATQVPVKQLERDADFRNDAFIVAWKNKMTRSYVLHALLNV